MRQSQSCRSYEIEPHPESLGGGCRLILLDDGSEVGSSVFPVPEEDPKAGIDWWHGLDADTKWGWLIVAGSTMPTEARRAYLRTQAYEKAVKQGDGWIGVTK